MDSSYTIIAAPFEFVGTTTTDVPVLPDRILAAYTSMNGFCANPQVPIFANESVWWVG